MPTELKDISEKKGNEADSTLEEPAPYTEALQSEDLTMEEGEFSDSDLLVDTDELQEWEQGQMAAFQEELEGGASNEGSAVDEILEEQSEDAKDKEKYQEKDPKKKAQKGGKRTAQSILSPRKKLLAKAVTKLEGKGIGPAKKVSSNASKGAE
ncbi:uncharacterized protein LOC130498887 isoform X2 [Raphanus sativus]|uniref:Uncharacterized protein LOC130498887 isoform X2 n=1 Tax=Raphanus sativus TaxID=3726 RepID=A0A9W3CAT4_RAPSA|nr:uncharacterized protein LOC130498887 isoform X2 [Raphanus sativus]